VYQGEVGMGLEFHAEMERRCAMEY
jgi:hypothetical protein